jgi:hypothetical protein
VLNNFRCANGAEFRHGERKGCLRGTRGDVLNSIELWARDFDRSSVYWLNGLAGTGKSTIAKTIAERSFVDGRLGASFFCSRDFEDRRNLQLILPTLAIQLARKYIKFRSILVPLIQSDPAIAYESLYNQMSKLIVNPLKESGISTVIVIDALDECEDEGTGFGDPVRPWALGVRHPESQILPYRPPGTTDPGRLPSSAVGGNDR